MALALISAAALATFAALLITSRPYDPMNSTIAPQESVPPNPFPLQSTPKPSPTISGTPETNQTPAEQPQVPGGETVRPDDTEIKSEIDRALSADDSLSNLEITATVENGKVTLTGSVPSPDLKARAEKLAHSIAGVTAVKNQLIIIEPSPQ